MNAGDAFPALTEWPHLFRPGQPGHPVLLMLHGTGDTETGIAPPNAGGPGF